MSIVIYRLLAGWKILYGGIKKKPGQNHLFKKKLILMQYFFSFLFHFSMIFLNNKNEKLKKK